MSSVMNTGLKALVCGMGALAITAVMSWSLVTSTSRSSSGMCGSASPARLFW
jgi:hypothetical protein